MVRDNGKGIPPEILENAFEPYFTTKDSDEGAGMGLAIVYGIVKNHGGAIRISSKVGSATSVEMWKSAMPYEQYWPNRLPLTNHTIAPGLDLSFQ